MEEFFVTIGNYLPFILIGCIEVILGLLILINFNRHKSVSGLRNVETSQAEKMFLNALEDEKGSAYILFRNEDRMPIYMSGDARKMLGVSLEEIQQDIYKLNRNFETDKPNREFLSIYSAWDGMTPLETIVRLKDNRWFKIVVQRSDNNEYDCWEYLDVTSFQIEHEKQEKKIRDAFCLLYTSDAADE